MLKNVPDQLLFCLKCRKKTLSSSVQLYEQIRPKGAVGKQHFLKGTCTVCGRKQSQFVAGKKYGGNLNTILNSGKLPELHLPGHNYTGPGTKLKARLLRGDPPVKKLDEKAQFHDMSYAIFNDKKQRHVFDKKLQDEAFNIAKDSQQSFRDRAEAGLVGGVMLAKRKLGLGVLRQKRSTHQKLYNKSH